jgi:hypothetical protein
MSFGIFGGNCWSVVYIVMSLMYTVSCSFMASPSVVLHILRRRQFALESCTVVVETMLYESWKHLFGISVV